MYSFVFRCGFDAGCRKKHPYSIRGISICLALCYIIIMKKKRWSSLKEKLSCNSPKRTAGENKSWVVKGCEGGEEKIVRFGDPEMPDKSYNPERRKNFRARHKCDQKNTKLSARYWSCKKW